LPVVPGHAIIPLWLPGLSILAALLVVRVQLAGDESTVPSRPGERNMIADVKAVLSQNITLLYDTLNLQVIDSSKLKQLLDAKNPPMLMDTPDMIVAAYPPGPTPIVVQFADRRIRVTLPQAGEELGSVPLWKVAVDCDRLVPKPESSLKAYGFNYDVLIELPDKSPSKVLADLFLHDPDMIESALQGYLRSFVPRVIFQRSHILNDLVLEATDEHHIKAHMNSHFESINTPLPPEEKLRESFYAEYQYLRSTLTRLFETGGQ